MKFEDEGGLFTQEYKPGERLQRLLNNSEFPNANDILSLWEVLAESEHYVGEPPTLNDFANWILGTGTDPCEVTW